VNKFELESAVPEYDLSQQWALVTFLVRLSAAHSVGCGPGCLKQAAQTTAIVGLPLRLGRRNPTPCEIRSEICSCLFAIMQSRHIGAAPRRQPLVAMPDG
jgi:hypothetical protein